MSSRGKSKGHGSNLVASLEKQDRVDARRRRAKEAQLAAELTAGKTAAASGLRGPAASAAAMAGAVFAGARKRTPDAAKRVAFAATVAVYDGNQTIHVEAAALTLTDAGPTERVLGHVVRFTAGNGRLYLATQLTLERWRALTAPPAPAPLTVEAEHAAATAKIVAEIKTAIPDVLTERPESYEQLRALEVTEAVALRNCLRGLGIHAHVGVLQETLTWVHVWVPSSKSRTAELVAVGFTAGRAVR